MKAYGRKPGSKEPLPSVEGIVTDIVGNKDGESSLTRLEIDTIEGHDCYIHDVSYRIDIGEKVRLYSAVGPFESFTTPEEPIPIAAVQILNERGEVKFQFIADQDVYFK